MNLQQHTLANGLKVLLHHDDRLPLVAVNLWYHVGSKHERPGRTGFAHLFEHMLFQGSQNVPVNDHFRLIQQVGGVANGSTWYDRTNYYETLPSHHLDLGLWLESDRMGFLLPAMTPEKLENQRDVVMNERRQRVDNQPYGRASERVHELLYPDQHPYHWPVIGYMEDIEAATLDDVAHFFETFYVPNNAVLTLAGDFDGDRAMASVARYFEDLPPNHDPLPEPLQRGLPTEKPGNVREVIEDTIQLPRMTLAHAIPGFGTSDWFEAMVLCEALTGGKSSLLYRDLVYERQWLQGIGCYVLPTEECATLAMVATARPDTDLTELEKVLCGHLERLCTTSSDEEDFDNARARLLADHYNSLQTLDSRADMLSRAMTFFDDPGRVSEMPARIAACSPEGARDVFARYATPENRVTIVVVPDSASTQVGS
jgi:zinc protease